MKTFQISSDQQSYECTGLSASWCPIHGDCVCDREINMDDPMCPLHNSVSSHGEPQEVFATMWGTWWNGPEGLQ